MFTITFTLTAPVGLDLLAGHLTWQPWALAARYRWSQLNGRAARNIRLDMDGYARVGNLRPGRA
jgi:hypothetical protein